MKNLRIEFSNPVRIIALVAAIALGPIGASADADELKPAKDGKTVIQTMDAPTYGPVVVEWLADANLAGHLKEGDELWVPGINPDGTMSLSTAQAFIQNLNNHNHLGYNDWRLPITYSQDVTCSFTASETDSRFGYNCGEDTPANPVYVFSELGSLFSNGLGGVAHQSILDVHDEKNFKLFKHIKPYLYWSQTAQPNNIYFGNDFWFQNGFQGTENEYDSMYVLPVRTITPAQQQPPPNPDGYPLQPACAVDPTQSDCTKSFEPGLGSLPPLPAPSLALQPSRDGSLIYDPVTNVTYLANANFAKELYTVAILNLFTPDSIYDVSGINPDGSMNQATLVNFLNALNGGEGPSKGKPYMGISTWNTPTTAASGINPDCSIDEKDGTPEYGYNCDGVGSQLGELFYDEYGGEAGETLKSASTYFKNLESSYYWQCQQTTDAAPGVCPHGQGKFIPSFSFRTGYEGLQSDVNDLFVILVAPGDVIPRDEE